MSRFIVLFMLATLLGSGSVLAADEANTPAQQEAEGKTVSIENATCQDLFDLYQDAVPAEGKDPELLEEAQDEVLLFVIWVHGYLSGRDGLDSERRPLSQEGIKITIQDIAEVCEPDTSARFMDVVEDIKK